MTRASTTLFWFSLTIFVSLGLYHTSYRVDELDRQLRGLNAQIETEQRNLHVLKAEWVYLATPARIEAAARKHLELQPTNPQQVASLDKIAELVPARSHADAQAQPVARAVATLTTTHAAAHAPKAAAEESGRLNTRVVFRKTAAKLDLAATDNAYPLAEDKTFALANSGEAQ